MFKRLVFLLAITSLLSSSLWCEPTTSTQTIADWVLAGGAFTLKSSPFQQSVEGITSTLPTLILENLMDAGVRILAPEEIKTIFGSIPDIFDVHTKIKVNLYMLVW